MSFSQKIIEESEERLKTEQEIQDLLDIITTLLPLQEEDAQQEADDTKSVEGEEMLSWFAKTVKYSVHEKLPHWMILSNPQKQSRTDALTTSDMSSFTDEDWKIALIYLVEFVLEKNIRKIYNSQYRNSSPTLFTL